MSSLAMPVIDTDSHITEPADLWTSRMSQKHIDSAPRVVPDPTTGRPRWQVGEHLLFHATQLNHAGWKEFYPSTPYSWEEADPAGWDAKQRLARMDEMGITAQVLFPNLLGFSSFAFLGLEPSAALECVRVFNDFQTEWASVDPKRLLPQTFLPFWDLDAALAEMKRCAEMGHKGINFGLEADKLGLPTVRSGYWDPVFAAAQDLELPVSFHIGFSERSAEEQKKRDSAHEDSRQGVKIVAELFLSNAQGIGEVIFTGVCHRFPRLNFVSVESGFGYVPFLLDSYDWQWKNGQAHKEYSDWLLPSEYFKRQVYATFWFESGVERQIDLYPDNVMFESDFPHPTSLSPGPGTTALDAKGTIAANLSGLPQDNLEKVLYKTASRVFHLDY
jgi:uncharacterized protein